MSYENGTTTSAYSVGLLGGSNEVTARAKLLEECLSIDTALLLFIIVAAAAVPSAKPQPKRSNWLFLLHSLLLCLCASVHTFPSTWSALLHCTPCLPLIVLLKYHLLHAALQDPPPPVGRVHFCFSVLWRLVQSYPRERAESSLLRNGPLEHFLGPQKFVRGLPVGWRLMLASGYERTIGGGPNFH